MSKYKNQKILIIIILIALLLMALVWCYFDERLLQMEKVEGSRLMSDENTRLKS